MTIYARIENDVVVERRDIDPVSIPPHKASLWRLIEGTPPAYDPVRQRLTGPVETIDPDLVRQVWTVEDIPADTIRQAIKAEARRRILARYPDWKQVNMTARTVELLRKGEANLTPAEATESAAMQAAWDWVKAVRAASDALEISLPADFANDAHWPV